jgi:hypothetical protein
MSKFRTHAIKVVEKFKKASTKEIERLEALDEKSKRLREHADDHPTIREYFDRLVQKRQQLSDDVEWSTRLLGELRTELKKKDELPKEKAEVGKKPSTKKERQVQRHPGRRNRSLMALNTKKLF